MKYLYIINFLLTMFLGVCNAQNTTLIGIDETESVKDASLLEKRRNVFQNTVWRAMKADGDRVVVFYVYENSGNRLNQKEYVLRIPKLHTENLTPQKAKIARLKYKKRVKKLRTQMVLRITKECLSYDMNRPQTHILEIFPLLQSWRDKYGKYNLVLFSDMIQFSSYRNHYKTQPKDIQNARAIGKQDGLRIRKDFSLRNDFLKDIKISIYMPINDMDKRTIFTWLPEYWYSAFSVFGSSDSSINMKPL